MIRLKAPAEAARQWPKGDEPQSRSAWPRSRPIHSAASRMRSSGQAIVNGVRPVTARNHAPRRSNANSTSQRPDPPQVQSRPGSRWTARDHAAEARVAQSRHPAARCAATPTPAQARTVKAAYDDIGEMGQDAGKARALATPGFALHVMASTVSAKSPWIALRQRAYRNMTPRASSRLQRGSSHPGRELHAAC